MAPDGLLRETLTRLHMTQAELARRTGVSAKHINGVSRGHVMVSYRLAYLLERATGVPAREWNAAEAERQDQILREADPAGADAALPGAREPRRGAATRGGKWRVPLRGGVYSGCTVAMGPTLLLLPDLPTRANHQAVANWVADSSVYLIYELRVIEADPRVAYVLQGSEPSVGHSSDG